MCILKKSIAPYVDEPFLFVETGINVYSFEELLFHCYHYWRESLNDVTGGGVAKWVQEKLELGFVAGKIDKIMRAQTPISEKYMQFLALEGYLDEDDLYMLEFKIMAWENKSELEKVKQQGDERLHAEDYEKALFYYEKLLEFGEDASVYNNIGCCCMKMGRLSQAEEYFQKAGALEPRNSRIKLNLSMLYSLQNRSSEAEEMLVELEKTDNDRNVQYYLGVLELRRNNMDKAEAYFNRAVDMGNTMDANAALSKIAMRKKDYVSAKRYIERITDKSSKQYLEHMAQINYALGDKAAALKNTEQLLIRSFDKASHWTMAAKLYRETGNLQKAANAVAKALELDAANEEAVFEDARLKKELGKHKDYQQQLGKIIDQWKAKYRVSV